MILTGRTVGADEALSIGLANRVVPDGQALGAAMGIAKQNRHLPQLCMNNDRTSAYRQWDHDFDGALTFEAHAGVAPLREGAEAGARRVTQGAGRNGRFADYPFGINFIAIAVSASVAVETTAWASGAQNGE